MTSPNDLPVLLTVRGTLVPTSLEAARVLHNETAGSEQGIAAARSLGDLSHKVYAPIAAAGEMGGTKPGELLFQDVWEAPQGIQQFFSNEHVQSQAAKMFGARSADVWMPARGSFSFHLPAPAAKTNRFVGMIRANVTSAEAAIAAFGKSGMKNLRDARRRGQMSHEIYFRIGAEGPAELLGVDIWTSLEGMMEHYKAAMAEISPVFAGKPAPSIWQQAEGAWSEW